MRKLIGLLIFLASTYAIAGRDIGSSTVNYVYQLDSDSTVFEFSASTTHRCGSSLFRVKSQNESVANRKFALILAAFVAGKRIAFHDREVCEGNRSLVGWVRLIN